MTRSEQVKEREQLGAPRVASSAREAHEQFVSFRLASQEYAVEIRRVQEIKGWESITRMPHAPAYVLGVVNLRGAIVPVVDLRVRLGMNAVERDIETVIVVVNVPRDRGEQTVGFVVDAVADVHDVALGDIQEAPHGDAPSANAGFVKGLAKLKESLLIILDVERLVRCSVNEHSSAEDLC